MRRKNINNLIYKKKLISKNRTEYKFYFFRVVDSTNNFAKRVHQKYKILFPYVFLTKQQTNGYGRFGRKFYSPKNSGIYISFLIPLDNEQLLNTGLLTTGTGVAVVKTLTSFFPNIHFGLKWVNDIYIGNYKCGGILAEDLRFGKTACLLIGIGLDINTRSFPERIRKKTAAIVKGDNKINRFKIAVELIDNFFSMYSTYYTGNFLPEYRKLSIILGKNVQIKINNKIISGKAKAITDEGGLKIVNSKGNFLTLYSGEVVKVNFSMK